MLLFSKERELILIQHLSPRWSNADIGGMWMFKIGPLSNNENILEPSLTSNSSKKKEMKSIGHNKKVNEYYFS